MAAGKKQSFLGGAAILAFGIAVVKVIGAVFKIPLFNILGEAGAADFNNAYNIYAALLTISTAGLPVALSKMVSEANTLAKSHQARKIFQVSFSAFFVLGLLSFVLMWWGDDFLAGLLHNPHAAYGIRALAPAVICVGCLSAFRGYAQGCFRMTPTAVSQIIEAFCKLVIGLCLAFYMIQQGEPDYLAAAGAITGVTIGTVLSLAYMVIEYFLHRSSCDTADVPERSNVILGHLLSIAIPITLSSAMVSIVTLIDTSLVQGQLQNALGHTLEETRVLYGTYSSGMNLYNLPSSLMIALTASVIPTVSASLARQDRRATERVVSSTFRIASLLSFPMGLGLWAMAEPIMQLFYPNYDSVLGGSLLSVLGLASIFVCLTLVTNSVLQAYGFVNTPIFTMLLGGVTKIVLNYHLVAIPSVNIHGAPIGTMVCFVLTACLNLLCVYRATCGKIHYLKIFTKPLLSALVAVLGAKAVYGLLEYFLHPAGKNLELLCVGVAILMAVLIYVILVWALRIITKDDVKLLPKGERIAHLLHMGE